MVMGIVRHFHYVPLAAITLWVFLIINIYINLRLDMPEKANTLKHMISTDINEVIKGPISLSRNISSIARNTFISYSDFIMPVSMEDHLKYYQHDPDLHYNCSNTYLPNRNKITRIKNVYQKIKLQFLYTRKSNYSENDIYIMSCYFDDRFLYETGKKFVRCFLCIQGPGPIEDYYVLNWAWKKRASPVSVLMWFPGFHNPVGTNCYLQDAAGIVRNVSNTFYYQDILCCVVPEIGIKPVSISIVRFPCDNSFKWANNIQIVYPEEPDKPNHRNIGVCTASAYGNYNISNVPFFVNWMETLNILGVTEITINNGSLFFQDNIISRAFEYYINSGFL